MGYTPPPLFINEVKADNGLTLEDPDEPGAFEDWIELYNAGDSPLDLGGMYLTDRLSDSTQWQVPPGVTIEAGAYLVLWSDDDTEQGDTHMNFKLSAAGETIALYDSDQFGRAPIDTITFEAQDADIAYGRCPDGSTNLRSLVQATPGESNDVCGEAIPTVSEWGLIAMLLLSLVAGTLAFRSRPTESVGACGVAFPRRTTRTARRKTIAVSVNS